MIHLIKLSVGTTSIESLIAYRAEMRRLGYGREDGYAWHRTRMMPKRKEELLDGGSIYWVFGGNIQCRQRIVGLEAGTDPEGRGFCDIVMDQDIIPVAPVPKRPFQGWRYLKPEDAPKDLPRGEEGEAPPPELAAELAKLGLI
jgi:hypothetical protein